MFKLWLPEKTSRTYEPDTMEKLAKTAVKRSELHLNAARRYHEYIKLLKAHRIELARGKLDTLNNFNPKGPHWDDAVIAPTAGATTGFVVGGALSYLIGYALARYNAAPGVEYGPAWYDMHVRNVLLYAAPLGGAIGALGGLTYSTKIIRQKLRQKAQDKLIYNPVKPLRKGGLIRAPKRRELDQISYENNLRLIDSLISRMRLHRQAHIDYAKHASTITRANEKLRETTESGEHYSEQSDEMRVKVLSELDEAQNVRKRLESLVKMPLDTSAEDIEEAFSRLGSK